MKLDVWSCVISESRVSCKKEERRRGAGEKRAQGPCVRRPEAWDFAVSKNLSTPQKKSRAATIVMLADSPPTREILSMTTLAVVFLFLRLSSSPRAAYVFFPLLHAYYSLLFASHQILQNSLVNNDMPHPPANVTGRVDAPPSPCASIIAI